MSKSRPSQILWLKVKIKGLKLKHCILKIIVQLWNLCVRSSCSSSWIEGTGVFFCAAFWRIRNMLAIRWLWKNLLRQSWSLPDFADGNLSHSVFWRRLTGYQIWMNYWFQLCLNSIQNIYHQFLAAGTYSDYQPAR